MIYSRSVFTFCRREGRSRSSETALYTKMAVEIGKQIAELAQTENIHVYYGGDFVYEEQINEAAVRDILVMAGGLVLVGLFMTMHFGSVFLRRRRGVSDYPFLLCHVFRVPRRAAG